MNELGDLCLCAVLPTVQRPCDACRRQPAYPEADLCAACGIMPARAEGLCWRCSQQGDVALEAESAPTARRKTWRWPEQLRPIPAQSRCRGALAGCTRPAQPSGYCLRCEGLLARREHDARLRAHAQTAADYWAAIREA